MARQPEYDRTAVVEQAMAVFWERGYGQTSVIDLVTATGLKPGSLYGAFGSKKGVFIEVIDRYNADLLEMIRGLRQGEGTVLGRVRGLLDGIVEEAMSGGEQRGCLTVNALLEMSQHDADIAGRLCGYSEKIRRAFADVLDEAIRRGEIDARRDSDALAAFLLNNIFGMRVMCRNRPDRASLEAVIDGVMASLQS